MGHKEIIEAVEAWPTSPSVERNTLDALVALYYLIDERFPEKPMKVIQTPSAPEDKPSVTPLDSQLVFNCTESSDLLRVVACSDGDIEFEILVHEGGHAQAYLSAYDAERLARAILASI